MVKILLIFALILTFNFQVIGQKSSGQLNVMDFGVVSDGVTLNTVRIQKAIDSCSIAGGTVIFPAGKYLTGSIYLRSNVTINLQNGATILGSTRLSDYLPNTPSIRSYNDYFLLYSLFYAENLKNITIKGEGTIDGQGKEFKIAGKEKPTRYKDRPYVFRFVNCNNIHIENITLQNSAMWMQHYFACQDVTIKGIRVYNHSNKNNDMIDIDGCKNVTISDCIGDTDDDGITLKSTSEKITENIVITNCIVSSHCNAIKTGTESTGGFKNISISNIIIKPSKADTVITGKKNGISGISLTNVDGGILQGITISNIVIEGTECPIFIRLGNRGRLHYDGAPKPDVGKLKDVFISHVFANNVNNIGCSISGIPDHPVENIYLDNIHINFSGNIHSIPVNFPQEFEDSYPESTMWGILPAYGFFIRHADGVNFRNCTFKFLAEDLRPALVFNDVKNSSTDGLNVLLSEKAKSAIVLERTDKVRITNSVFTGNSNVLVDLKGNSNERISILNNHLYGCKNIISKIKQTKKLIFNTGNIIY